MEFSHEKSHLMLTRNGVFELCSTRRRPPGDKTFRYRWNALTHDVIVDFIERLMMLFNVRITFVSIFLLCEMKIERKLPINKKLSLIKVKASERLQAFSRGIELGIRRIVQLDRSLLNLVGGANHLDNHTFNLHVIDRGKELPQHTIQ